MKQITRVALLIVALSSFACFAEKGPKHDFDPAFTHVVYFWLKDPDSGADRHKFEAAVNQFMKDSKYAKTRFVGVAPASSREVVDDSFTYSLILSFESAEAQEKYQAESAHKVFVETCKELWDKVIVYDSIPLGSEN